MEEWLTFQARPSRSKRNNYETFLKNKQIKKIITGEKTLAFFFHSS